MSKKPVTAAPWAYSKLHSFETCPFQFYHEKVAKTIPFRETEAIRYGNAFHSAAEHYVRDGTPLPARFKQFKKMLDSLTKMPGKKYCEHKMGITVDLATCKFFATDVWWRGVVDLLIVNGEKARVIDYKTGGNTRYADTGQLELMALATFLHFPEVKEIKAGLLYVVANKFLTEEYKRSDVPKILGEWLPRFAKMEKAFELDIWHQKPSGLCNRHCDVLECPHNGRG